MNKTTTVMKDSFKDLYFKDNNKREDLVNDDIPNYWRHSLRNNNKKLKSHVLGHQFSEEKG